MLKRKSEVVASFKRKSSPILFVIFIALILRLVGITHSFPFIFHPDEPTVVRSALGVRFYPNPGHFDWPHLYIYLNYFLYMIFARFRTILEVVGLRFIAPQIIWDESVIFYLLTRIFTAILSGLTVIPVYKAAKRLFSKRIGLLSALAMAVIPFHVWHSHYSLTDAPMVFFLSWVMYFGVKIYKKGELKDYLLAGLFVGLSASTKYNGGLSALIVPLAYLLRKISKKESIFEFKEIGRMVVSGFMSVLSFVLGTPYSVLDFKTFIRTDGPKGALWQFKNVGSVSFPDHVLKFFSDLFIKLPDDLGYTILLGFIFVLGMVVFQVIRKKVDEKDYKLGLLLIPALFYIWYISGFEKSRSHYYMIIYPFIAVCFGYFVFHINEKVKNRWVGIVVAGLVFILPVFFSAKNSYTFAKGDTRNDLRQWLISNLSTHEAIIYNDRKATDIIENIGATGYKGLSYMDEVESGMVLILDAPELEIPRGLRFIHSIEKYNRLGPEIRIYRYENN